MSQVVYLGVFDAGEVEVSIEVGTNVSYKESVTGFGDEDIGITTLGAGSHIAGERLFNRLVKGNDTLRVGLVGTNGDLIARKVNIGYFKVSQLGNTHTGLEQELDNGSHSEIFTAGITESPILDLVEDTRRLDVVLGVGDVGGRVFGDGAIGYDVGEERLDGVDLTGDGFGGVVRSSQAFLEGINVFFFNLGEIVLAGFSHEIGQLLNIFGVG